METAAAALSPSNQSVMFHDFLDKMRNPASLNLVRSIKSFIVSFSFYAANPGNNDKKVQEFFSAMQAAISGHQLWAAATAEEIDHAMEGLEKYVMTKLFSRTFGVSSEDVKIDQEVLEKIHLLQSFLKPEHLDIPAVLQDEASWLFAEKELQKINAFKAPHEKLQCIMSCCRAINNVLLNASMSENRVLGGADEFLPMLIYVTIKANPPQLHSNLKFIQLYRRQEKLVSESAYYLTNLVSVKSFIINLNAKSLSIDEIEFEEKMEAARLATNISQLEPLSTLDETAALRAQTGPGASTQMNDTETNKSGHRIYPYMEAKPSDLTVEDIESLLSLYKDVVGKYTSLCRTVKYLTMSRTESFLPLILKGTNLPFLQPEGTNANVDLKERKQEVTGASTPIECRDANSKNC